MSFKFPLDFENRMKKQLLDKADVVFASYEDKNIRSLRLNPLKQIKLPFESELLENVAWEKNGRYYGDNIEPGRHPLHNGGAYYIQEASAMAPAALLDVKPGDVVLDLCAAPGGKSTQLAGYLGGEGLLVCNEIVPKRAQILSENIERLGVRNALVISENPLKLYERFADYFDKILVDAPCSGEGMFRKHPEAMDEWSLENVEMCAARQAEILDCAAKMLKAGGRMVYSTCTFAPAEDEECIRDFLFRHPEFSAAPLADEYIEQFCSLVPDENIKDVVCIDGSMLHIYPGFAKGEGHFLTVLEKEGTLTKTYPTMQTKASGLDKAKKELLNEFLDKYIASENVKSYVNQSDRWLLFGDKLYIMPEYMPDIKGLKVYRAGLMIGEFLKNRFEPAHALALTLGQKDVKCFAEVDEADAQQYLKGMTLNTQKEDIKGWTLITHCGCSLGFSKASGGILKNHYPKGLRVL